jgi:DNA-binding Xre family transcriptional regulator
MAKRWSIEEDIIIGRFCIDKPGAYHDNIQVECIARQLQEAGFEARSNRSIQHRVYAFEIVREGRQLPYASEQVAEVYKALINKEERNHQAIVASIREFYNPNGETGAELFNLNSTNAIGYQHTIDFSATFPMVLQKFLELKKIKKHKELCESIGMKPDTFSAILRGKYGEVKKDNVLRICIGLELSTVQAEELLNSAGYTFSNAVMLDVVIKACIYNRVYNRMYINLELHENGVPNLFQNYKLYSPLCD